MEKDIDLELNFMLSKNNINSEKILKFSPREIEIEDDEIYKEKFNQIRQ